MKKHTLMFDSLLTALAPAIWGSTYLITTELLPPGRPLLAAVLRALPAGLILLAIGRKLPAGAWWWRALVLGVLNIGAFFYFLFVAAYHLPGGVAALVMSIQPMIVLLLGLGLLGERIRPAQVLACLVGALGIALLVLKPAAKLDSIGILAGLAGASSMAAGIVLTKRWGRPEGVSVLNFTGWQLVVGGAVLVPVAVLSEGMPPALTDANWLGFAYLGIVGALFAYMVWFRGIQRLPALTVSFLSFASPLMAALLGYVFLGQSFSLTQMLGAGAVIAAVVIAQPRRPNKRSHPHQPEAGRRHAPRLPSSLTNLRRDVS